MKAVILCAGEGTRLRPLTDHQPKVMLPLNGRPLLEHHIQWLTHHGIRDVCINLHYRPDRITEYFGDGSDHGIRIVYAFEETLQDTAGALNGFRKHLDEPFLVHYGDVYSDLDISQLVAFHRQRGGIATLVVRESDHPEDSDIVVMDNFARIQSVHHKPGNDRWGHLGNAACYLLEPAALEYVPRTGPSDFIRDVFPRMLDAGEALFGYLTEEFIQDMGTFERYEKLQRRLSG